MRLLLGPVLVLLTSSRLLIPNLQQRNDNLSEQAVHIRTSAGFTFAVAADMREFSGPGLYDTTQYFRGAIQAMAGLGGSAFLVSPGDIDPTSGVFWTITQTLGEDYRWYPAVGNHELPGAGNESFLGENMDWLRGFDYGSVNPGPPGCPTTTYSFNYEQAHFVILNEYCDSDGDTTTNGDIPDHLYQWLVEDLSAATQRVIFVFGHEPAYPQPDADNGRIRHTSNSLNLYPQHRDRFWQLLQSRWVTAYICGHTHNYSAIRIGNVWQIDAGHARGLGDVGARSTFLRVHVDENSTRLDTYRDDANGGAYTRMHQETLWLSTGTLYLPIVTQP